MEKKEKQKIKNQIILNSILLLILCFFAYYLFLQYEDLGVKITDANTLYSSYIDLNKNGIDINDLSKVSAKYGQNKVITNALLDKERLRGIISKPRGVAIDYPNWLSQELLKEQKYNEEVKNNQDILGNILPIFYQYGDGYSDDKSKSVDYQITLDNFTSFVENKILKQNDISSYSSIGIDNIIFDNGGSKLNKNNSNNTSLIGYFVLSLDFQGYNSKISKMIEYIQNSGKLDIQNGKLVNKSKTNNVSNFSALDNLLMTIDNITLKDPLLDKDARDNNGNFVKNSGTIKIKFYVRGLGFEQLTTIRSKSLKDINDLYSEISNKATFCDKGNNPLCKDGPGSEAVANLRSILKDISAIKAKVDAKTKIKPNQDIDVNQELSEWLSLASSINAVESASAKSVNYINNFIKSGAK